MSDKQHRYLCQFSFDRFKPKVEEPNVGLEYTSTTTAVFEFYTPSTNFSKRTQADILKQALSVQSGEVTNGRILSISYLGYMNDEEYFS